jgi:hypothetical protein
MVPLTSGPGVRAHPGRCVLGLQVNVRVRRRRRLACGPQAVQVFAGYPLSTFPVAPPSHVPYPRKVSSCPCGIV